MDFPGNQKNPVGDNKSMKEEKVITQVVTTEVIHKPTSFGRRFRNIFLGGSIKSVFRSVGTDVLIPAFRAMIVDAADTGVKRAVMGEAPRRRYEGGRPRVSYNSPVYRDSRRSGMLPDQPPLREPRPRRQDVGEIILVSASEAENVIERLSDIIDKFDVATIADLHELCGLPTTYVDNKWGWTALNYANVRQVREGFLLDLPPVEPI